MSKKDDEREERRKSLLEMSPDARILSMFEKLIAWAEAHEGESSRRAEDTQRKSDEMQRNMDFIVRQQAQFSADMQQLRESQERAEQRWERIERRWERTEESVRNLHAIAQIHEREITTLAEAQARTTTQMAETDERINALVNTVERLIGERGEEKSG
jgi:chromosome segregation ATPase